MFKKVVFYSDTHGHLAAEDAIIEVEKSIDLYKPDYVICGGDIVDLASLRKGASDDELALGFEEDVRAAILLLKRIKPSFITYGNHDYRAFKNAVSTTNGILRDACRRILNDLQNTVQLINAKMTRYHLKENAVKLDFGGPLFLHGFRSSIVSPAKFLCENYSDAVAGHVHSPDMYISPNYHGYKAFTVGLIADPVMDFNDRQMATFKHRKGHGLVEIHDSGAWNLYQIYEDKSVWFRP